MTSRREPLHLGAFLYPGGHHVAAWRHPSAQADAGVNAAHYRRIAQVAEAAKFDLGADLSAYPDDAPVPDLPETEGGRSRQALILTLARREGLTIRELSLLIAGARGHGTLVGTASRIADALQERFEAYGADGFNIMPPTLPGGLDDFAALVIPELQRRGLFRTDYAGRTLRAHLGLPRPPHRVL